MGSRERSKNCVDFPSPFDPKELKMASGVAVSEDVKIKYDEIKKKKTHRYCVFFIKDEKLIAVEKIGGRDSSYEEFLSDIMPADLKIAVTACTTLNMNTNVRAPQRRLV